VTRFFNEARATARIKHPGIVEILDCGTLPNAQAYIVMEFLPGETLGSYAERYGKLSSDVNLARAIVRQVAMALAAAHARGIIHRDLKPDNVFLCSEGGAVDVATVKILDFGIAKLVSAGQLPRVTTTSAESAAIPSIQEIPRRRIPSFASPWARAERMDRRRVTEWASSNRCRRLRGEHQRTDRSAQPRGFGPPWCSIGARPTCTRGQMRPGK